MSETLMAIGVGGLVLAAVASMFGFSGRSFSLLGNYVDFNQQSLLALDHLSLDFRRSTNLVSITTNQVVMAMPGSSGNVTYSYSPQARTLSRVQGASTRVLLRDCNLAAFSIFQRTLIPGTGEPYATTDPNLCKVLTVSWSCSRSVLGRMTTSQQNQTAKIVRRPG